MDNLKKEIIDTGLYLLDKGLIARTWGNISARLNDDEFLITPSGKAYTDIKQEDIAIVKIKHCEYDKKGPKPSGERKVHAAIYRQRKDVKYIVHTHQFYASAICGEGYSIELPDGTFLPCAKYGLPGTKTLEKNIEKEIIDNNNCSMMLMEKHGALIFGSTLKEVLDKANYLEEQCKIKFESRVKSYEVSDKFDAYIDDYAQMIPCDNPDDKEALKMIIEKNSAAYAYSRDGKPLSKIDRSIQHFVYKTKYSKLRDK